MKIQSLLGVILLSIACIAIGAFSAQKISALQETLNQERYNRMVAEEKLDKTVSQLKSTENETTNAQNQTQSLQAILEEEKKANAQLRTELDKMGKLKNVLEQELKDALVKSPGQASPPAGP